MLVSEYSPLRFANAYAILLKRYLHKFTGNSLDTGETSSINLRQLDQLVRDIYQTTGDLGFGLDIGRNIHPSDYGIAGYAMLNCATLLDAIKTSNQYRHKLKSGFSTEFEISERCVRYRVTNADDLICLFPMVELDFASGLQFARLLVGPQQAKNIRLQSVRFKHLPLRPVDDYENFFGCKVHFDAEQNVVELHRDSADIPVHGANPKLFSLFDKKLGNYFLNKNTKGSLPDQVRYFLKQHIDHEFPNQEQVAKHFFMSVSCLKNRLKKLGTSFQFILDEVRGEEAKRLLADSDKPIKEISSGLGFANQSAFNRAFKRWTGANPRDYRKHCNENSSIPA